MTYVEVLVADAAYHGNEALTYSSGEPLHAGQLVLVPLRKKQVLGIVVAQTQKPSFAVKPVVSVAALPVVPNALLGLLAWMRGYYPAPLGVITQLFLPKALPKKPVAVDVLPVNPLPELPELTSDQTAALQQITATGLHILHGETGTGKTRVYIELARLSLERGASALILTPEIGLTSQLANDFRAVFGERVAVVHSGLTEAQRERTWQYLLEQPEPMVVIGARSALFSP
ncbi:MAG TPA: DEAD/DEAH box helicase, partial [Candidatus Saccharimonadales bacterium]|nr:DEAD/DEAH box helicase [Candidatus Saccharimonadales bacterium]